MLDPLVLLALAAVGMLAGFVDAIAGGGGMIALPALLSAGLPPVAALATNKLQSVSFAIIGRRFASRYGFIPPSGNYGRLLEALTLERILLVAIILMLVGIGALVWGVGQWAARDFGPLNASRTLRPVILAMTALVSGFQLMMSGFMSSMINIPIYERRLAETARPDDTTP